jgi:hypothetical protein
MDALDRWRPAVRRRPFHLTLRRFAWCLRCRARPPWPARKPSSMRTCSMRTCGPIRSGNTRRHVQGMESRQVRHRRIAHTRTAFRDDILSVSSRRVQRSFGVARARSLAAPNRDEQLAKGDNSPSPCQCDLIPAGFFMASGELGGDENHFRVVTDAFSWDDVLVSWMKTTRPRAAQLHPFDCRR